MLNNQPDDTVLAARIRNSNREAFGLLYNRYRKIIYFFSLKYLSEASDAEEIVQTVFVSIWEHRDQIDEKKPIKNYIFRIAVNFIYNALRKKAIRRKYMIREMEKPEGSSNPYEQIFFNDLDERIGEVINTLPPQQQKIFSYRHFEGLSHEEIAERLDISVRTVENQIYRVNKILKKEFRSEMLS
jgi:RNA polymerase sigma-70 factor (ECF subfamily)